MADKKRILVVPSDRSGCGYYRSVRPHTKLDEMFGDEFAVTIEYNPKWEDLDWVNQFDLIHLHKGLFNNMNAFRNALAFCKANNIVTIDDVDDYWDVGQFHPAFLSMRNSPTPRLMQENLALCDYCTTTTDYFAKKIAKYNKNVKVWVNAIDPNEEQFIPKDEKTTDRIRIGFIMGSSHEHDMEQIRGVVNSLGKDILDKIQIVLCGYDLRGDFRQIFPDGHVETRPIRPEESVWYKYEKNVTDNYSIVTPEYKEFLTKFEPNSEWPNVDNEGYRRVWTKDISEYATHYNKIDILLAPIAETEFNACKSELKLIEAGFFKKAVICSNFGAYKIGTRSLLQKGGAIDETGNCILVDPSRAHKDWAKAIKKLVTNPELITLLGKNLHNDVATKYNLENVTRERAEWYRSIIKR